MFRLLNTHLDHEGSEARLLGLNQLLKKIDEEIIFPDIPVIIAGDFNAEPDSPEMQAVINSEKYYDLTAGVDFTFHDYGKTKEKIDYIFVSRNITCKYVEKWDDVKNGVYISDHYPIQVDININNGGIT